MLNEKAKATIDALPLEELRFEIAKGRKSRFQKEKYAYLQVRLGQLEEEQQRQQTRSEKSTDTLPPEPPKLLRNLRWLQLHGLQNKPLVALAIVVILFGVGLKLILPDTFRELLSDPESDELTQTDAELLSDDLEIGILTILAEPNEGQLYSDTVLALRLRIHPDQVAVVADRLARRGLILRSHRLPQGDYTQFILEPGRRFLVDAAAVE